MIYQVNFEVQSIYHFMQVESRDLNLSEDLNKTTQIFFAQLQPAGYFEP